MLFEWAKSVIIVWKFQRQWSLVLIMWSHSRTSSNRRASDTRARNCPCLLLLSKSLKSFYRLWLLSCMHASRESSRYSCCCSFLQYQAVASINELRVWLWVAHNWTATRICCAWTFSAFTPLLAAKNFPLLRSTWVLSLSGRSISRILLRSTTQSRLCASPIELPDTCTCNRN